MLLLLPQLLPEQQLVLVDDFDRNRGSCIVRRTLGCRNA